MTLGEVIGNDFSKYSNIDNWLKRIKGMPSWSAVNEIHNGFAASMQDRTFITTA
jgi:glutathione S-transferase